MNCQAALGSPPFYAKVRHFATGGAASTGRQRMLEVQPTGLHQRVPVFLGSKDEVEAAVRYHAEHDAAARSAQSVA